MVKFVTKADDTKTYQTDVDMELTKDKGTVVATWKSKEAPTELVLELGDYSLKVVNAPEGYELAQDIIFRVLEDGTLEIQDGEEWIVVDGNTIVMIDPIITEIKGVERFFTPEDETKLDLNLEKPEQPKETVKPTVPEIQTGTATSVGTILSVMALSMVGVVRFKKEM